MNTSFVIRNFSCVSFEMYISFLWYTDKTGSFNSFLFIYLTIINWDGNTKQRNLHVRLIPVFIMHQSCYLNKTAVEFVMRTKGYDFIIKKRIHSTVFTAIFNNISLWFNPNWSCCISLQKGFDICIQAFRINCLRHVNGISVSLLLLLFYISHHMLLCICRKCRFLYIVVKPAN